MGDPFDACEEAVRRHDPDRYFAALFAPEEKRRHLFALYSLYYALAHAVEAAREPMLVNIRLAWWCETLEGTRAGNPRDHHVAKAMQRTLAAVDLPGEAFERIIAARASEAGAGPFADTGAAEAHADATSGELMRLASRVLGVECDAPSRGAGLAYAFAGQPGGRFNAIDTGRLARAHYEQARRMPIPHQALPAFLPAVLVPLYLKKGDPPLWRKQLAYLVASWRGRL